MTIRLYRHKTTEVPANSAIAANPKFVESM